MHAGSNRTHARVLPRRTGELEHGRIGPDRRLHRVWQSLILDAAKGVNARSLAGERTITAPHGKVCPVLTRASARWRAGKEVHTPPAHTLANQRRDHAASPRWTLLGIERTRRQSSMHEPAHRLAKARVKRPPSTVRFFAAEQARYAKPLPHCAGEAGFFGDPRKARALPTGAGVDEALWARARVWISAGRRRTSKAVPRG